MPSALSLFGRMLSRRRADEGRSVIHAPELQTSGTLSLSSPRLRRWRLDALETTAYDANHSPSLAWSGVPAGTQQLVLIMEDFDVPVRTPLVHTVAVLDRDVVATARGGLADGAQQFLKGGFGHAGYHGPRPFPVTVFTAIAFTFTRSTRSSLRPQRRRGISPPPRRGDLAPGSVTGTFERNSRGPTAVHIG